MDKTLGQLLDAYLETEIPKSRDFSSLYMYMQDYQTPKIVINTTEQDYDYTQVLYELVDLREQVAAEETKLKALQDKVRQLNKSKSDVEKAIKLLTTINAPKSAPEGASQEESK